MLSWAEGAGVIWLGLRMATCMRQSRAGVKLVKDSLAQLAACSDRPPSLCALLSLPQACVAASLSVGVLQVLSAAVQYGSSLWSAPLSAPMIFSFQANQGSWGLYW